jgi:VWFA-related protein
VFVIDDVHMLPFQVPEIQRTLTEFVNTLTPNDEAGVVFVRRSDLSVNLTRDPARLLGAVKEMRAAADRGEDLPTTASLARNAAMIVMQDAQSTAFVLKNVAAALAASGRIRRAMIYVGTYSVLDPSAPLDGEEHPRAEMAQMFLNDAFASARRSGVPIYTFDPRGIPTPEKDSMSPPTRYQAREQMQHRIVVQQDHLSEIAVNTNGRAFINRPELTKAMDELMEENGSFYLLGYYPSPFAADGKEHAFEVHVKRPGLRVRSRTEYVASASVTPAGLKDLATDAMSSGMNLTGLDVTGWAAPVAFTSKGLKAAVTAELTYPMPIDGPHHIDDEIVMTVMALDPDGKVQVTSSRPWKLKGDAPGVQSVKFLIDDVIDVPSKPLTLRIGLASQAMAKVGTIQLPFASPSSGSGGVHMGGVAIRTVADPHEQAVGSSVLAGSVPFQPMTARVFTSADGLRIFVPVFWDAKDPTVTVAVSVKGQPSKSVTADLPSASAAGNLKTASFDRELSLAGLAPGDYVLDVTASIGGKVAGTRSVPFAVR